MELSVCMGDRGCGYFITLSMCRSGTISLVVMKSPDNYASEAEDMTPLIIWARDRIGLFSRGMGSSFEQKICNPARLQAQVLLKYAAS